MSSTEDTQYSQHFDGLMNVDDHNDSSTSYDNRSKRQVVENLSDQDTDLDAEDDFDDVDDIQNSKKRNLYYIPIDQRFASTDDAKLYMRNNKYRYRGIKNGDKKGHKLTFSCSRYDNCPRKGYIQLNNGQDGIRDRQIFFVDTAHKHDDKIDKRSGFVTKTSILKQVRVFVINLIKTNRFITNLDINKSLRDNKFPQLQENQIYNLRSRIKNSNPLTNIQGSEHPHLGHLMNWANSSKEIPTDPDAIFCLDFNYKLDKHDQLVNLNLVISTTRLLDTTDHAENVGADTNMIKQKSFIQWRS